MQLNFLIYWYSNFYFILSTNDFYHYLTIIDDIFDSIMISVIMIYHQKLLSEFLEYYYHYWLK